MTLKICKYIGHNVCLVKWIASIYSSNIFPVSHFAKLISALIILSFKHQNPQGGLDALSISPFFMIDDNPIKASYMIFNKVLNLEIYLELPLKMCIITKVSKMA
jgi:hypothetical protein